MRIALLLLAVSASAQTRPNPFFNGETSPVPGMIVGTKPKPAPAPAHAVRSRPRCPRPVVWIENGALYKNGHLLGNLPTAHDTTCTGAVYWTDLGRGLFKDSKLVGSDVISFRVEDYSGSAAWTDSANGLWKDGTYVGANPVRFELRRGDGEVVWIDVAGGLFKGSSLVASDAVSFELTFPDGRLVWTDRHGLKHLDR